MAVIVERELSYIVNGCIFDVHNDVGPGVREECYQKSMEIRLAEEDVSYLAKPYTRISAACSMRKSASSRRRITSTSARWSRRS